MITFLFLGLPAEARSIKDFFTIDGLRRRRVNYCFIMQAAKQKKGKLFVISGPSGVGKGTVARKILERNDGLTWSVSSTTRKPRNGEINGKDYDFLSPEDFENKINSGDFLEWAVVHGYKYGTQKASLEKLLTEGKRVLVELDVQGALKIQKSGLPSVLIFLLPPSQDELLIRLKGRNSETEETMQTRLETAKKELELKEKYDYTVVNESLEDTVEKIEGIIKNK